jgi:hypothetical protein
MLKYFLSAAGLVIQHRRGRQRIYRLNPASLKPISDWVSQYEQFWTAKLDALGEHLEEQPSTGITGCNVTAQA